MSGVSFARDETLEKTLNQYGDMILRLAFSCLKSREDAEDVLQDVLLRLIEHPPAFESEDHEKAWLIRVTINLCRNRLRQPWRRHLALDEALAEDSSAELQEESDLLAAVLALPVKYREVIHLFYYEDYSITAISGILHKKESTIRSLLHRGRAMLKESLKEVYLFDESF